MADFPDRASLSDDPHVLANEILQCNVYKLNPPPHQIETWYAGSFDNILKTTGSELHRHMHSLPYGNRHFNLLRGALRQAGAEKPLSPLQRQQFSNGLLIVDQIIEGGTSIQSDNPDFNTEERAQIYNEKIIPRMRKLAKILRVELKEPNQGMALS